ncbi:MULTISPECIES: DinB family protein [Flavobacterium]|uniref:DinB family protein n=1 Tax=Flavobacterium jumunjinense TaxID=998845 RepID=A0ABV5GSX9_9FLAO|nr:MULTISPECIES: DinB family protein [Flavobacterium]
MLIASIKENFKEIIQLLDQLSDLDFTYCHPELSNATIGEHTRHIIELYQVLIKNYSHGLVNYDKRERNLAIQTSIVEAKKAIENILSNINQPNKDLLLEQGAIQPLFTISTNYFRELLYNLEHSIHHQALIKVAILKNPKINISQDFGVAKSTIEFKTQCVQ